MSLYRLFLFVNSEFCEKNYTSISFDDKKIHFYYSKEDEKLWILTKVAPLGRKSSQSVLECFTNRRQAQFLSKDSFLEKGELDGQGIYLKRSLLSFNRYQNFSLVLKEYLQESSDWQAILT